MGVITLDFRFVSFLGCSFFFLDTALFIKNQDKIEFIGVFKSSIERLQLTDDCLRVHLCGGGVFEIFDGRNAWLIEDPNHAPGCKSLGKHVGECVTEAPYGV